MLAVIWVMFLARWAFPRFRYDQIMRLGWKMMLPISLANVVVSAGVFLGFGREGLAVMGILEWLAFFAFVSLSAQPQPLAAAPANGAHASGHGDHAAGH
jgi:hypothetical protein